MKHSFLIAAMAIALAACDEGRIPDVQIETRREGLSARASMPVKGYESWPAGYTLALAAFNDGNEFAVISKNISVGEKGICNVVLTGIPTDANSVELCAIDRLRRRIATFATMPADAATDTIRFESETLDLSMFGAIQREVFNTTCTQCHGGAGFAAAGLNLTAGKSYADLVGCVSAKQPGELRVDPGAPDRSLLYRILASDESATWSYDHSVEVTAQETLDLIHNWIENGAIE